MTPTSASTSGGRFMDVAQFLPFPSDLKLFDHWIEELLRLDPFGIRGLQGQDKEPPIHEPGNLPTTDYLGRRGPADRSVDIGVVGAQRGASPQADLFVREQGI